MAVAPVLEQFPVASHQRISRRYENAVERISGRRSE